MGNLRIEPPIGVIILGQVANYGEMTVGQLLIISKSFLFISVVSQILDFGIVGIVLCCNNKLWTHRFTNSDQYS